MSNGLHRRLLLYGICLFIVGWLHLMGNSECQRENDRSVAALKQGAGSSLLAARG
jgi:hypothetical protein